MIDTQKVKDVIDELDPEGLLANGAPSHEYTPQAEDFADLLSRGQTMTTGSVTEVWTSWFKSSESQLVANGLATKLAELLNTIR